MEKQESKYRWVVFGTVLFVYLLIVSQRTAPGLITDQLMKEFNMSASMIGLLTSIQFFAYAALQIPIGILSDRFGPNLFLIVGTMLSGIGTIIYSMAGNEFVLLFARLLAGVGDAAIWVNLVLILSQWFKVKEFVGLLGIAGMSGSFGFLLATVPFSALITLLGWRDPFFIMGIILSLGSALLYFILVKKPKQKLVMTSTKNVQKREKTTTLLRRIFYDRRAWAAFLCHFGVVGTYVGFIGSWAVPYGMHVYGMTRSSASQFIMVGLIGAMIGSPFSSWLSNRLGSIRRPYVFFHLLICAGWIAFVIFDGKPPVFMLFVLFLMIGFGNGANPLTFATVRQAFPIQEVGVVSGFANTGGFLSAILLPAIFGKILDHFQASGSQVGYHYGFIIPVVFSICGLVGGLLIKEHRVEEKKVVEKVAL
ncbi:MFS transporter [Neobacillus cucumis]|uniref:MFS transporter n=1 Tax=Neobacillus cucumis TaxID=1740721 RepID=UPI002E21A807|nr:MFS transporter [Neobacillus cucumis]MED4224921.1 MFS transporter [Neobacillus cucumis]